MDFYRDEFRRQLKAVDEQNTAAMKPWREALMRVFSGGEHAPTVTKAHLTGAPDLLSVGLNHQVCDGEPGVAHFMAASQKRAQPCQ